VPILKLRPPVQVEEAELPEECVHRWQTVRDRPHHILVPVPDVLEHVPERCRIAIDEDGAIDLMGLYQKTVGRVENPNEFGILAGTKVENGH
jgi:hypothetical protein